ncbi:unnamed protein product [Gongylonema pulchrum]|uniref:Uncharacterized protein n=1 Tax=Gongylonema pulchrum TaxID=637853 RepID=A0A3P6NN76_9BILA|nr:unnamed protein product [Gongylonema pulchrum]
MKTAVSAESVYLSGLLKRGSNGIRQSGHEIVSSARQQRLNKSSARSTSRVDSTSAEVSSTTEEFYDRLGVKGLVSDRYNAANNTVKVVSASPTTLFGRAITETAASHASEPISRNIGLLIRIHLFCKLRSCFTTEMTCSSINGSFQMRPKFDGAVRKRRIQKTQLVKSHVLSLPKAVLVQKFVRPSIFDRLS